LNYKDIYPSVIFNIKFNNNECHQSDTVIQYDFRRSLQPKPLTLEVCMWIEPTKKDLREIRREFVVMYPLPKTRTRLTVDYFLAMALCRRKLYMPQDATFNAVVSKWTESRNSLWEGIVLWWFCLKMKNRPNKKIRSRLWA